MNRKRKRRIRLFVWSATMLTSSVVLSILAMRAGHTPLCVVAPMLLILLMLHPWMQRKGGVPVLIYHSVSDRAGWIPWSPQISVTTATFQRHLEMINRGACTVISTRELMHARKTGKALPARPVVIHFDDGYLDNWVAAVPILQKFGFPATVFVSLDFIEEGDSSRPNLTDVAEGKCSADELKWDGYLNQFELLTLDRSDLVTIESHGIDHGRVETSPEIVSIVSQDNWRFEAWKQWAHMPGNKTAWHLPTDAQRVPYETPIRENRSALVAQAWDNGELESESDYLSRVSDVLERSRQELGQLLGHSVDIFCWPYNAFTDTTHELAIKAGFTATTSGTGENRDTEDPARISRVHVHDRAIGWHWPWAETISLYAVIRLFQGNYYWYFAVLLANTFRFMFFKFKLPKQRLHQ